MPDSSSVTRENAFSSERELVSAMIDLLRAGLDVWGIVDFGLEFDYRRGRPDIVAVSGRGDVIAIEAKLRDWREALHQAYRNTSFAAESYILMPLRAAKHAVAHVGEFERLGVGICTIVAGDLEVLHPAKKHGEPLEPWLTRRAALFASSSPSRE